MKIDEIKEFLKENLTITIRSDKVHEEKYKRVRVQLFLGDEKLSEDTDYV